MISGVFFLRGGRFVAAARLRFSRYKDEPELCFPLRRPTQPRVLKDASSAHVHSYNPEYASSILKSEVCTRNKRTLQTGGY